MSTITLVTAGTVAGGDTQPTSNTLCLRNASGGGAFADLTCSELFSNGPVNLEISTVNTSTTGGANETVVLVSAVAAPVNITLPGVVGNTGRVVVVKKIDTTTNAVTVIVPDSALIEGQPTKKLVNQYESAFLTTDGINWYAILNTPTRSVSDPVLLSFASTTNTDVSTGASFYFTATGNFTLANPTGSPVDGQKALWRIKQDGTGSRLITLGSAYKTGTDIGTVTLSTAANATDYLGAIYRSASSAWDVVTFIRGYA